MSFIERLKRLLGGSSFSSPEGNGGQPGDGEAPTSISCMEALERVQEYLDGELGAVSHEEVAQHFEMCQRCYPHLKFEEQFRAALERSQRDEVCPEHVRTQVLELLATEAGEGGSGT